MVLVFVACIGRGSYEEPTEHKDRGRKQDAADYKKQYCELIGSWLLDSDDNPEHCHNASSQADDRREESHYDSDQIHGSTTLLRHGRI